MCYIKVFYSLLQVILTDLFFFSIFLSLYTHYYIKYLEYPEILLYLEILAVIKSIK